MRIISTTVLVLCLSSEYTLKCSEDDFVDPLDMLNYDRSSKSMKNPTPKTMANEPVQNERCTVFLSRFINILLINTGLSNIDQVSNYDENKELKLHTSVTLSVQDLELLKNMANKRDVDYTEIDRILSGLFTPVEMNSTEKNGQGNSHLKIYHLFKQDALYWISVGCITIVLLYIIFKKINYICSLTFVLFIIFALGFASTWYTMYMKAEINRSVQLEYMPTECREKTGWTTFSWFKSSNLDQCKRYKEAIFLDPKYSIAMTDIFAEMFSKMLTKPIEALGESIYVFNKSVLKDIPFLAQVILIPIIIVIIIKTVFLSCSLLVGRGLSTKYLFGYGDATIGAEPTNNDQYTTNKRINNSFHPMISAQHTAPQIPALPNVNFNINLSHPSPNENTRSSRYDDKFKINYAKESNLIAMLKNRENDSVDSKDFKDLIKKAPRHRTLSM
ncbi:uncharacterized protein LOC100164865 [Acyrthosiphon pisum]|uniref:Chloride channel CLIC-like protein 1 n=1 Tax=Acyrthosiphon pisum TaxID=7029 RepID=A0A8R2A7S7_ACYPI|nr:uncharacterized protein LOC100164865 [Acyrthosiphon pisum]|eukprot:XP_001949547.1 PREDICTED: uncharacterized protein LOC100164865 [Acyrthosiphon pisum]